MSNIRRKGYSFAFAYKVPYFSSILIEMGAGRERYFLSSEFESGEFIDTEI